MQSYLYPEGEMGMFGDHTGDPGLGITIMVNPETLKITHEIAKRKQIHICGQYLSWA